MDKIFEQIADRIITKEDLIFFIEEINSLQGFIFKDTKIPLSERAKNYARDGFVEYIKILEERGLLPGTPDQQLSFFKSLRDFLEQIPQLKLEIAFSPSENFPAMIRQWFWENNKQKVIIDLTINPNIVGGAVIEYKGQYANFSLLEKMNESISLIKV